MLNRPCSRVACSRPAAFTLTFDYHERLTAIGPLAIEVEPHTYDLCAMHADRLTVPAGWTVLRPVPLTFDA